MWESMGFAHQMLLNSLCTHHNNGTLIHRESDAVSPTSLQKSSHNHCTKITGSHVVTFCLCHSPIKVAYQQPIPWSCDNKTSKICPRSKFTSAFMYMFWFPSLLRRPYLFQSIYHNNQIRKCLFDKKNLQAHSCTCFGFLLY